MHTPSHLCPLNLFTLHMNSPVLQGKVEAHSTFKMKKRLLRLRGRSSQLARGLFLWPDLLHSVPCAGAHVGALRDPRISPGAFYQAWIAHIHVNISRHVLEGCYAEGVAS